MVRGVGGSSKQSRELVAGVRVKGKFIKYIKQRKEGLVVRQAKEK